MARKRGLSEKSFYAFNPLPAITDADVLKRAGLDELMTPVRVAPFHVSWKYGGVNETEIVQIPPQEMFLLRESECKDFTKRFAEEGMVLLEDPNDAKEVRLKSISGLQRALTFWSERGKKKLVELRKLHGYSREDMDDYRFDHWVYYANQAKADFISDALKVLKRPTVAVTTSDFVEEFSGVVKATKPKPKPKRRRARAKK